MKHAWLFAVCIWLVSCQPGEELIYISAQGNRVNPGTKNEPVATFDQAIRRLEEIRKDRQAQDVRIVFLDEFCSLDKPIRLDFPDLQNENTGQLTLSGLNGRSVHLSGGTTIDSWRREGELWVADLQGDVFPEQLYVNGRRALRARIPNPGVEPERWYLDRVNWVHSRESQEIVQADLWVKNAGETELSSAGGFEVVIFKDWATMRKRVTAFDPQSGRVILTPPHVFFEGNYNGLNAPYVSRFTCFFEGHPDFIDLPGEWAVDEKARKLYYYPLPDEDPEVTMVVAPRLETLLQVSGEVGKRVGHILFENLVFEHAAYQLPPFGHDGRQACFFYNEGTGIPAHQAIIPGAVDISWASDLRFSSCRVHFTGANGIWLHAGSRDVEFDQVEISDIGGNGVMIGTARDPGPESEELVRQVYFRNGEVTRAGRHFDSAVGIWLGFTQGCGIIGNEVYDLPYTGISVGWQWNPVPSSAGENLIADNHIYRVMQMLGDGGGIYTLGNQPGSVIRNNEIHDILRSELNHASPNNGMFIDEGSKNYLVEGNHIYRVAHTCIRGHRAAGVMLRGNTFESGDLPAISHTPPYGNMIFSDRDSTITWPNPGWPEEWGYPDSVVAFTMEGNIFN